MKALWTALLLSGLLGNTAHAVQTCPNPGPHSAPDSRYTLNGDGTVTDSQTGLMWKQCSEGQGDAGCSGAVARVLWEEAMAIAEESSFAGFDDWRVPNGEELGTLVETACIDPAINTTLFPNTLAGGYWTATEYPEDDDYIWYFDFLKGKRNFNGRSSHYGVRLVRDAK